MVALRTVASIYAVYRIARVSAPKINRTWKPVAAPFMLTITMFTLINIGMF